MTCLAAAVQLVEARRCRAQPCVIVGGEVDLDRAVGCRPDSLFFLSSASKPMVALLVHLLAERGQLSLDDPVARLWPAFGQRGKQAITIRLVSRSEGARHMSAVSDAILAAQS